MQLIDIFRCFFFLLCKNLFFFYRLIYEWKEPCLLKHKVGIFFVYDWMSVGSFIIYQTIRLRMDIVCRLHIVFWYRTGEKIFFERIYYDEKSVSPWFVIEYCFFICLMAQHFFNDNHRQVSTVVMPTYDQVIKDNYEQELMKLMERERQFQAKQVNRF